MSSMLGMKLRIEFVLLELCSTVTWKNCLKFIMSQVRWLLKFALNVFAVYYIIKAKVSQELV